MNFENIKKEIKKERRKAERRKPWVRGKYGRSCVYLENADLTTGSGFCRLKNEIVNFDFECSPTRCQGYFWKYERRSGEDRRKKS